MQIQVRCPKCGLVPFDTTREEYSVAFRDDGTMRRQLKCQRCNAQYIEGEVRR